MIDPSSLQVGIGMWTSSSSCVYVYFLFLLYVIFALSHCSAHSFIFDRFAIQCNAFCSTSSNALHSRWLGWTLLVTSKVFRFLLLTLFCPPACACVCLCVLGDNTAPSLSSSHSYVPPHRLQQEGRNFIEIIERTSHGQGVRRTHWRWSWEGFPTKSLCAFLIWDVSISPLIIPWHLRTSFKPLPLHPSSTPPLRPRPLTCHIPHKPTTQFRTDVQAALDGTDVHDVEIVSHSCSNIFLVHACMY